MHSFKEALIDISLNNKRVCIFENHAQALLPWSRWATQAGKPLALLTIDHHSDTNSCYLRSLFHEVGRDLDEIEKRRTEKLQGLDIASEYDMIKALGGLYHDEHIHAALRLGILSHAYVIQHSFTEIDPSLLEKGMTVLPCEIQVEKHESTQSNPYFDEVLESDFLNRQLQRCEESEPPFVLDSMDYILDIDLDVFKSHASVTPSCCETFLKLIWHAVGVTIARESEWIERLKVDESLNAADLEKAVIKFIEKS